ncbi:MULTISPECIES: UvrD-helicase domain-containing protein [Bradyrhizobium]|uniref:DNA 3'-5' helicase II n=2 Tax=Bradyrhizobium ottawaense TaxID=931866 RepID=A0ABV4FVS9_9BRAD|nr:MULTISPECIES: UvrD-helicase domain-containing protein [Bradyrhizobium]MCS3899183.1 DNA helicase-2/ATP-dependent DNA helicase PcrA [Bradyrhizobium japonicum USDA 38]MCS3942237.1 DNA helicase-2/ATP-dependent DNA helicase PcrA [Bradyrhizobium japonicum]WQN85046.1 UvrD-helicase domain-containing protein [Bradyrhizobium ottawaense]
MTGEVLIQKILSCRAGSVVAPAGCGKTECITDVLAAAAGRYLVLTHTLAGVDALRKRLAEKKVNSQNYDLDTIAGWSLRLSLAFPQRSGLSAFEPKEEEWSKVYAAAQRLIERGAISSILKASYAGVLIDEYQDCTISQHSLVKVVSRYLPTCVFGDYLQSIFGFRHDPAVDWDVDVVSAFPRIEELAEPWRWKRVGNIELGRWLMAIRDPLKTGGTIDLSTAPNGYIELVKPNSRSKADLRKANVYAGLKPKLGKDETLIVISDKASEIVRAALASKIKCSSIEPVGCKRLAEFILQLKTETGKARLESIMQFAVDCMTGVGKKPFMDRVDRLSTGWRGAKPLSVAEAAALEVINSDGLDPVIRLLEALCKTANVPFRRELMSSARRSIKLVIDGEQPDLDSAAWQVQNTARHAGRRLASRSVGSTLLVKGLQFDHAVIVAPERLEINDLYVAMTSTHFSWNVSRDSRSG